jgi:hypothetical protein
MGCATNVVVIADESDLHKLPHMPAGGYNVCAWRLEKCKYSPTGGAVQKI